MLGAGDSSRVLAYRFGAFELNPENGELRKAGIKIRLQEQPYQVLYLLLRNAGEIVTREQIQKRLWPDGTFVDFDNAINSAVRKLRDALGDAADNPRYIETLPRKGYRFVAPVTTVRDNTSPPEVRAAPVDTKGKLRLNVKSIAACIAGITVLGAAAWLAAGIRTSEVRHIVVTPLTTNPGHQLQPAFAPDGARVAFSWEGPGGDNTDIYVKLIGPGDPVRLTSEPTEDYGPAWSPDGRWIAALRSLSRRPAVILIPATGGPEREVTRIEVDIPARVDCVGVKGSACAGTVYSRGPSLRWSSDGKFLFTSAKQKPDSPLAITRIEVESGEQQIITSPPGETSNDLHPAVSPDGRTVAFLRTTGFSVRDIWTLPLSDGAQPRRLTTDGVDAGPPVWTPEGRELIFSSNRGGRRELWRVSASGSGKPERITGVGENARTIDISPRQDRLIYEQSHGSSSLWKIPLQSRVAGEPQRVTATTRADTFPHYSPNQKKIAFQSDRSGVPEIWVCDADGSNAIQLTSFGRAFSGSPRWSPDGRSIVFDSNAEGNEDIWLVNSQGGRPVRLTTNAADDIIPSWSHDGQWIYFSSKRTGRFEMWKIRLDGSSETQLTTAGGYSGYESVDGKYLFYKGAGASPVWRIPVEGGTPTKVTDWGGVRVFTPVKSGVYLGGGPAGPQIRFLDLVTGEIRVLADLGRYGNANVAISPDAHWALYSRSEQSNTNLILADNFR
jgi:Tol biopolymer transport system component/DNA-binding winged helix-turn-helix (wHTH) protein